MSAAMNPTPDELDRRLDAALRRRYSPPASLETLAERARPRVAVDSRLGPVLALACAAAAAIVGALGWWTYSRVRDERSTTKAGGVALEVRHEPLPELATCSLLGPLDAAPVATGVVQSPDLARLYRDMDACQRGASADECEDDEELARRLQALELRPGAAELLHGPFLSAEWPSGQILTGSVDDQTVALVVERSSTLDCCVHPRLHEGSGLNYFTWPVGDLTVTEITPHAEPRLISCLE